VYKHKGVALGYDIAPLWGYYCKHGIDALPGRLYLALQEKAVAVGDLI